MKLPASHARVARSHGRRRLGAAAVVLLLFGVFGLTGCHPSPADTALKLSLFDTASSTTPAANVTVSVYPAADSSAPATASGITDSDGNVWFTHTQLPAGGYVVMFGSPTFEIDGSPVPGSDNARWYNGSATDAATSRDDAATVTVTGTEPTQVTESYAVPRGHIDDTIDDAAGHHLSDVEVTAIAKPSGQPVATTTTSSSGLYHFGGLPAQNYTLEFSKPGYGTLYVGAYGLEPRIGYSVADGPEIPAVLDAYGDPNYVLRMSIESTISGTVTDGADPVSGVIVGAYVGSTDHLSTATTTAADGTFTLHGLRGIGYKLGFADPSGAHSLYYYGEKNAADLSQADVVKISGSTDNSVGTIALPGNDCAAAQTGTKYFFDGDLRNCPLEGMDFSGAAILSPTDLTGADLSNANLHGTGLFGSTYTDVDFSGADVSYADMSGSTFTNVDFTGADFTTTDINNADLSDATLTGVVSSGVRGTPAALPTGWTLVGGVLVPPA